MCYENKKPIDTRPSPNRSIYSEGPLELPKHANEDEIIVELKKARNLTFDKVNYGCYFFETQPGVHVTNAFIEAYSLAKAYDIPVVFKHNDSVISIEK